MWIGMGQACESFLWRLRILLRSRYWKWSVHVYKVEQIVCCAPTVCVDLDSWGIYLKTTFCTTLRRLMNISNNSIYKDQSSIVLSIGCAYILFHGLPLSTSLNGKVSLTLSDNRWPNVKTMISVQKLEASESRDKINKIAYVQLILWAFHVLITK